MNFPLKTIKLNSRPTNGYKPIETVLSNHLLYYPTPSNLTYSWSFGSLVGLFFALQILTGIILAMHYTPHVDLAFASVEHIMQDVTGGYLFRYFHANGASAVFILIYLHIARNLYYQSYLTRPILWQSGLLIFLLMMATAFIGYVLPWGQMSFWGATVITSLVTAVPFVGQDIAYWVWGGFSINNATLTRFFSLHYLLPFLVTGVILGHLILLHTDGSSDPLTLQTTPDKLTFHPYFTYKDTFILTVAAIGFAVLVAYLPNMLGHSDNFLPANPLVTPAHIVPEWYFTPFYAILRACPNKLGGAIGMFAAIVMLFFLPYYLDKRSANLHVFAPYAIAHKVFFWFFVAVFLTLIFLGSRAAAAPYVVASKIFTVLYFAYFLVIIPVLGVLGEELFEAHDVETSVVKSPRGNESKPRTYENGVLSWFSRGNFRWTKLPVSGDRVFTRFFDDATAMEDFLDADAYRFVALYVFTRLGRFIIRWWIYLYIVYKTYVYWKVPGRAFVQLDVWFYDWEIGLVLILLSWILFRAILVFYTKWAAAADEWVRYGSHILATHGSEYRTENKLETMFAIPKLFRPVIDKSTRYRFWVIAPQFEWEQVSEHKWLHHETVLGVMLRLLWDKIRNTTIVKFLIGKKIIEPLFNLKFFDEHYKRARRSQRFQHIVEGTLHLPMLWKDRVGFTRADYFYLSIFRDLDPEDDLIITYDHELEVEPIHALEEERDDDPYDLDDLLTEDKVKDCNKLAEKRWNVLRKILRRGVPYETAWQQAYAAVSPHEYSKLTLRNMYVVTFWPADFVALRAGNPISYPFFEHMKKVDPKLAKYSAAFDYFFTKMTKPEKTGTVNIKK